MPIVADYFYHYYASQAQADAPVGVPVVLLHGAGVNHLTWQAELRRMKGFRIYALDLPGHGKSGGRGLQSIKAYAESVLAWMSKIGLHGAVFVGHSMGAAIAMTIALEHPDQTLGLGLVGAAARLCVSPELLQETSSSTTLHNAIRKIVSWSFSPTSSERLRSTAAKFLAETRQSILHGDFLAASKFDITAKVSNIHAPTVIICGEKDKMTPIRHSQYLNSQIKGASLHIIPEAGHMVMLEKPAAVADVIKTFLLSLKN